MGGACSRKRADPGYAAYYVGKKSEYKSNMFKEVEIVQDCKILVAKISRKIYAVGGKCPHTGAPLGHGVYFDGRIRCPYHGACFDFVSGELEDFPGFDGLPCYRTSVKRGKVYVHANPKLMPEKIIKPLTRMRNDVSTIVIIGSGACGYTCAQVLRQEGFDGRLIMITKDSKIPYDRTLLSKDIELDFEKVRIRIPEFYEDYDIELILNKYVQKIDLYEHKVYMDETSEMPTYQFENILIATGQKHRFYEPTVLGSTLKNIYHFYTYDDAVNFYKKVPGMSVLIVGSSFLAMEVAETISTSAGEVNMLSRSRTPYGVILGEVTGTALLEHFKKNCSNFNFYECDDVKEFEGNAAQEVRSCTTVKKRKIYCEVVLVAIGGVPNTEDFVDSPLKLHPLDRSVLVNKYMETNMNGVYAGGDCACFPLSIGCKDRTVIPHWQAACAHGKVAALNMLNRDCSIKDIVPFYYTSVFHVPVRYVGSGELYDEIEVYGSIPRLKFCAVYLRKKRFIALCTVGCDTLAVEVAMILEDMKDWTDTLPPPIKQKFPEPPLKVGAVNKFTTHHELHVRTHDLEEYDKNPQRLEILKVMEEHTGRKVEQHQIRHDFLPNEQENANFALEQFAFRRVENENRLKKKNKTEAIKSMRTSSVKEGLNLK